MEVRSPAELGRTKDEANSGLLTVTFGKFLIIGVGPCAYECPITRLKIGIMSFQVIEETAFGNTVRLQPQLVQEDRYAF